MAFDAEQLQKSPKARSEFAYTRSPEAFSRQKLIVQNIDTSGYRNAAYSFLDFLDAMIFDEEQT